MLLEDSSTMENDGNDCEIVIDGETEVDDLLLASKFAELENIKYESILSEIDNKSNGKLRYLSKVLTDNENDSSDSSDSENEECDDEIKELIKSEMRYRYKKVSSDGDVDRSKTDVSQNNKYFDCNGSETSVCGSLSNEYLSTFGFRLDEDAKERADKQFNNFGSVNELEDDDCDDNDYSDGNTKAKKGSKRKPNEKGKSSIDELQSWLPNIEIIDMPEKVDNCLPCEYVGEIYSEVKDGQIHGMNGIYIVKSDPSGIILDLGSVICLEDKTIVGTIIDTFGPISNPFYVLSKQEKISSCLLTVGVKVYCDRRHSTILGKGGKVRQSCLSEASTRSNGSNISLNRKSVHSLFVNKEFAKEINEKLNNATCNDHSGSELEEGEEDNYNENESGDDIDYGKAELSNKKFVERYDNLGLIEESCIEDSLKKTSSYNNHNIHNRKQRNSSARTANGHSHIRRTFQNANNGLNSQLNNKRLNNYSYHHFSNYSSDHARDSGGSPFINQANQMGFYFDNSNNIYKQHPQMSQNHFTQGINGNNAASLMNSEFGQSNYPSDFSNHQHNTQNSFNMFQTGNSAFNSNNNGNAGYN